jgi:hypothetical protein
MTASRDPDRLIDAFLAEGRTELPDRTYDAVRAHIDRTRQRVVIGPWREPRMPTFARVAIAAAAVLVAGVIGVNVLGGPGPNVGRPGPSPTATASPSASLIPVPALGGDLEPGTYVMDKGDMSPVRTTLTFPAGWKAQGGGIFYKDALADPGAGPDIQFAFWTVDNVYGDVCNWRGSEPKPAIGPTVEDLVTAFMEQGGRNALGVTDVTVGGYPAKKVELVLEDFGFSSCDGGEPRSWLSANGTGGTGGYIFGEGQRNIEYIAEADGERVVLDTMYLPGTSSANLAELDQIIESIRFEP